VKLPQIQRPITRRKVVGVILRRRPFDAVAEGANCLLKVGFRRVRSLSTLLFRQEISPRQIGVQRWFNGRLEVVENRRDLGLPMKRQLLVRKSTRSPARPWQECSNSHKGCLLKGARVTRFWRRSCLPDYVLKWAKSD
jgi:hypothetical protein